MVFAGRGRLASALAAVMVFGAVSSALAQSGPPPQQPAPAAPAPPQQPAPAAPQQPASASPQPAAPATPAGAVTPSDYVIGPDDVLVVVIWREKDISGEVQVRPDGKISLPLVNDIQAAGLTPEQLRVQLTDVLAKYVEQPTVSIVVKTINSRKVFITGQVAKPGPYPLAGPTTIMQLISVAGGVTEFADTENISVLRMENGKPASYRFNYKDVVKRKNLKQNLELKPGDTVIVP